MARMGLAWPRLLLLVLTGLILAAFAGLIPMGNWRTDEYHDFGLFRAEGWSFWLERLLTWSPRPVSEALAGLYFLAEEKTRLQLLAPFLALIALPLLVGPALSAWRARRRGGVTDRVLLGAVTLCLFLLGHPVAEVFYWPMGAVAYATTLAAVTALTFQCLDGRVADGSGRVFSVACLLVAAGAAEVGAIFAIFFAAAMTMAHATGRLAPRRAAWPWLFPLLLGIVVMIFLSLGRGRLDERITFHGIVPNPQYQYRVWASMVRAVPTYFRQMTALDGAEIHIGAIAWGAIVKLLVCLGLLAFFRGSAGSAPCRHDRLGLVVLLISLQATFVTTIAGSYFKFGLVCCERHDTFRQCLFALSALAGTALLGTLHRAPANPARLRTAGVALLGLALGGLALQELPSLRAAYAVREETIAIRHANWQSGQAPGPQMTMVMAPLPPVVDGMMPPLDATFDLGGDTPWVFELIMRFYGKQQIRFAPVHPQ